MKNLIVLLAVGWLLMKMGVSIFKGNDFDADYMPYTEHHDVVGGGFQDKGEGRYGGDYTEHHYQAPRDESTLYYRGRSSRTGRYVRR